MNSTRMYRLQRAEGAPYSPPAGPEKPVGTTIDSNGELARLRLTLQSATWRRCLTAVLRKTGVNGLTHAPM